MLKILLGIVYLHITLPYASHHVFIDLKNYNGKKQCLLNMLNFPLFIYFYLYSYGYILWDMSE